jgi:hypothetical protein
LESILPLLRVSLGVSLRSFHYNSGAGADAGECPTWKWLFSIVQIQGRKLILAEDYDFVKLIDASDNELP